MQHAAVAQSGGFNPSENTHLKSKSFSVQAIRSF
jgi:hypothetical protein